MKKVVKLLTVLSVIALPQLLSAHIFKVTNNWKHSVVVMIDSYNLSKETAAFRGPVNELPITFTVPQGDQYSHRIVSLIQPDVGIDPICIREIKVTNEQRHPLVGGTENWPKPWCSKNWQWEITITEKGEVTMQPVENYFRYR